MSRILRRRRPSAALVVAVVALVAALGGTAIAGNKIHFGSLAKDTKQKVLPYGGSAAPAANCDPTDAKFKQCVSAQLSVSKAFQRRALVIADGTFVTDADGAKGKCRLEVDGTPLPSRQVRLGAGPAAHDGENGDGFGLNAIAAPIVGSHTYSMACSEDTADIKIRDAQLTVITLRG